MGLSQLVCVYVSTPWFFYVVGTPWYQPSRFIIIIIIIMIIFFICFFYTLDGYGIPAGGSDNYRSCHIDRRDSCSF